MRRLGLRIVLIAILVAAYVLTRKSATPPKLSLPPNPKANVELSQTAWDICVTGKADSGIPVSEYPALYQPNGVINNAGCNTALLGQINARHRAENIPPLKLPSDFISLSPAQQLLVAANAERTSRGLPPISGVLASLNQDSLVAAKKGTDPNPSKADGPWTVFDSIWAGGYPSTLMAIYDWMYNDGWGGTTGKTINLDCSSAKSKGCWGHRQAILDDYQLSQGEVLLGGSAVVVSGPPSLAVPSLAAAFEAVPAASVKVEAKLGG